MPAPSTATRWQLDAIGTVWQIDTVEPLGDAARAAVLERIDAYDRTWSRFRTDSLITEISARSGTWALPSEAGPLLGLYERLHEVTGGAVTPLIGRRLADLGYDARYSLRPHDHISDVPDSSVLRWEPPLLTATEPVVLDIGAAGKGLLADLVAVLLPDGSTVDASGDLVHGGTEPLRVALEHPFAAGRAVGVVEVGAGRALCGSAVNRRAWGDGLHHVLDARTGEPTRDVVATWALADTGLVADGVATAAFFTDPAQLVEAFADHRVAVVRMQQDGRLASAGEFIGEWFL